jgi:hypothetical protein
VQRPHGKILVFSMTTSSLPAEFTLVRRHVLDRASPMRWIVSHAARYWPILIVIVIGAYGNGALAAAGGTGLRRHAG